MTETSTIIIPPKMGEISPAHAAFVQALQGAYDLHRTPAKDIKWVTLEQVDASSIPSVVAEVAQNHPRLSVNLYPINRDGAFLYPIHTSQAFQAPLLVRDVQRWSGVEATLGKYRINSLMGVLERESMLSRPHTLKEMLEDPEAHPELMKISPTTPVVELLAFLPIAPNGEFGTEFCPHIQFSPASYTNYALLAVNEDKFSRRILLNQGMPINVPKPDENLNLHNWDARFFQDMGDLEKFLSPSSRSHMIIVAAPYEIPEEPELPTKLFRSVRDESSDGFERFRLNDLGSGRSLLSDRDFQKSVSMERTVGDVSVGQGTRTGTATRYTGEISHTDKGNTTIYHLRFLGVKPSHTPSIDEETLAALTGSLRQYQQLEPEAV